MLTGGRQTVFLILSTGTKRFYFQTEAWIVHLVGPSHTSWSIRQSTKG